MFPTGNLLECLLGRELLVHAYAQLATFFATWDEITVHVDPRLFSVVKLIIRQFNFSIYIHAKCLFVDSDLVLPHSYACKSNFLA